MALDFTLDKYSKLLEVVNNSGYKPVTIAQYLNNKRPARSLLIRHDVDRQIMHALRMAQLEDRFGIQSSYYFRYNKNVFKPEIIKQIAALGHEIGYHYETLDKAKGDPEKAYEIFKQELAEFRDIVDVKTICMHGNPLTKWDNRDLWKHCKYEDCGIIGEAYLSIDNIAYLSDTGRNWGDGLKVKDWLPVNDQNICTQLKNLPHKTTEDVIAIIKRELFEDVYILVHPERWGNNLYQWFVSYVKDTVTNGVKKTVLFK